MNSERARGLCIGLAEAAVARLEQVERRPDGMIVALPGSYGRGSRRYPLVILRGAADIAGSAIEMSRLVAQTREVRECLLAVVDAADADLAAIEQACRTHYRVSDAPALTLANEGVSVLVDRLRATLATGHAYGTEVVPLRNSVAMHLLRLAAPLLGRFTRRGRQAAAPNPYRVRSQAMERDFEVFVALPQAASARPVPALVVLDANIEFSTVAETAARLAASGAIPPLAVIGIGVPRAEGPFAFALRRFEEYAPPTAGYDWNDDLGRIFRSLFAIGGQDARTRLGRAPALLRFLSSELLPALARELNLDPDDLGILGHSAGGTFACFALAQPDAPFRRYAAVSPGIGISGSWLLRHGGEHAVARRARQAYVCLGRHELDNAFNRIAGIHMTQAYAERLRAHRSLEVTSTCFDGETHSSVFPRAVEGALRTLYGKAEQHHRRSA